MPAGYFKVVNSKQITCNLILLFMARSPVIRFSSSALSEVTHKYSSTQLSLKLLQQIKSSTKKWLIVPN